MFEDLYYWGYKVRTWFRDVIGFLPMVIGNIVRWLPCIYKDQDFDHYYLSKVIIHKLKLMEKFYRSDNAWAAEAEKIASELAHFREMMEYIAEETYEDEGFVRYNTEFLRHFDTLEEMIADINRKDEGRSEAIAEGIAKSKELYLAKMDEINEFLKDKYLGWWD